LPTLRYFGLDARQQSVGLGAEHAGDAVLLPVSLAAQTGRVAFFPLLPHYEKRVLYTARLSLLLFETNTQGPPADAFATRPPNPPKLSKRFRTGISIGTSGRRVSGPRSD
jgi:hypothetical protein